MAARMETPVLRRVEAFTASDAIARISPNELPSYARARLSRHALRWPCTGRII